MSVKDMIKKSVLESGAFTNYDVPGILTALAAALLLGALIYLVYRKFYAGVVFSRTFAVTLVGMTVLTVFPSVLDAKSRKLPPKQREMVLF